MDSDGLGRVLIVAGVVAIVVGLLVRVGALGWFGNLPGDIRIESDRTRVFIPVTSMVIVSVVLSVLLSLLRR
ncbi:MAG: DUF2905 domain-containing protein [Actinobacteria bacterium]|nr:DUF2905 domain-containing protein [Actinomycetota bacterium]